MRYLGRALPTNQGKDSIHHQTLPLTHSAQKSFPVSKLVQTSLKQLYTRATTSLETLTAQVSSGTPRAESWNVARNALEALPLATEEAAVMRNRLTNSQNYLEAGERGAARYELRLLRHTLAKVSDSPRQPPTDTAVRNCLPNTSG
jgi:hypothetical protein